MYIDWKHTIDVKTHYTGKKNLFRHNHRKEFIINIHNKYLVTKLLFQCFFKRFEYFSATTLLVLLPTFEPTKKSRLITKIHPRIWTINLYKMLQLRYIILSKQFSKVIFPLKNITTYSMNWKKGRRGSMHSTRNPPLQLQETPNVGGGRVAVLESLYRKI